MPRHHTKSQVLLVIEPDLAADSRGVTAEAPLPETIADQDYTRTAGAVFFG